MLHLVAVAILHRQSTGRLIVCSLFCFVLRHQVSKVGYKLFTLLWFQVLAWDERIKNLYQLYFYWDWWPKGEYHITPTAAPWVMQYSIVAPRPTVPEVSYHITPTAVPEVMRYPNIAAWLKSSCDCHCHQQHFTSQLITSQLITSQLITTQLITSQFITSHQISAHHIYASSSSSSIVGIRSTSSYWFRLSYINASTKSSS